MKNEFVRGTKSKSMCEDAALCGEREQSCIVSLTKRIEMLLRFISRSAKCASLVLEDPLSAALMAVLATVDSNLEFLCEQAQQIASRRDESIRVGVDTVRTQLYSLIQEGFVEECVQTYDQVPLLLAAVLEQLQIRVPNGSYVFYRATKQGRRAYRNYCRHLRRSERTKLFWI